MFSWIKKRNSEVKDCSWYEAADFGLLMDKFATLTSAESKLKFIKIVVNYLTYKEAFDSFLKGESDTRNDSFYDVIEKIDEAAGRVIVRKYYGVHPDDKKYYGDKLVFEDPSPKVNVPENALLLNAWNGDRVIRNFININADNPFDSDSRNIQNYYIKPLNILVCKGANHSQLSAVLGEGSFNTSYVEELDISPLYECVKFDGAFKFQGEKINLRDCCSGEMLFCVGILFEAGRGL